MFSTFTGNSRRPRNVNLSGQTNNNPFANTAWSPSVVSNASKTVSNAQAQRERRQVDRLRHKAAGKIQKTWRGHLSRTRVGDERRAAFDELSSRDLEVDGLQHALVLLLSFCSPRHSGDLGRLVAFANTAASIEISLLAPAETISHRMSRLAELLISSLRPAILDTSISSQVHVLFDLLLRLARQFPGTLHHFTTGYYAALGDLCRQQSDLPVSDTLVMLIGQPLDLAAGCGEHGERAAHHHKVLPGASVATLSRLYAALAFELLASGELPALERHMANLAAVVNLATLASVIRQSYVGNPKAVTTQGSLWLLSHFIHLARHSVDSTSKVEYVTTLSSLLSMFSGEIRLRIDIKDSSDGTNGTKTSRKLQPFPPYVSSQLLSLAENDGMTAILSDFSMSLEGSGKDTLGGIGLLAGLISTLMLSFPAQADEMRMKLFLDQIPTPTGPMPIVKLLWQTMRETQVLRQLHAGTGQAIVVFQRYLHGIDNGEADETQWHVILLFLELYIFILRLSDDEDFLSGIRPQISSTKTTSSRLRKSSLSLEDIRTLTIMLKNSAFTLYYCRQDVTQFRSAQTIHRSTAPRESVKSAHRLDFDSLRGIITTAMKMLYERDARLHFLPPDHWLMTEQFDAEAFMRAVIDEEYMRMRNTDLDSDDSEDSDADADAAGTGRDVSEVPSATTSDHSWNRASGSLPHNDVQRQSQSSSLAPKLEILKNMPFVVPFDTRVKIFRKFIRMDWNLRQDLDPRSSDITAVRSMFGSKHHGRIRRGQLFQDAYDEFYKIGDGLKDPIHITFIDRFDTPEAGIDGGGVTKEFLTSVISEALGGGDVDLGLFSSNNKGLLYPDPTAVDRLRHSLSEQGLEPQSAEYRAQIGDFLRRFEFLGRIFGKCMYEGILVDVAFAGFFLLKWPSPSRKEVNSYKGSINDLRDLDEELYNGLLQLKNESGDVANLGIDFTVVDSISKPGEPSRTITRNLIPNGDQITVTNDNRLLYNSYVARHRLIVQPALQTQAFLRGLREIIKPTWLSMFNQSELQRLVGGDSSEIDLEDLRRNTVYSGLYEIGDDGEEHPTIKLFWKVFSDFTDAQKRDVLKYVSSTPRAPLLGFSQLNPKFSIRDGGTDEQRLPSASTCVNLLKLPRYTSERTMREKLLYAVTSGAGFDLS